MNAPLIITTTDSIENRTIEKYVGIVSGYTTSTVCVCGTAITAAQTSTCSGCGSDKFGFSKKAYTMRDGVIEHLKCVMQVIRTMKEK